MQPLASLKKVNLNFSYKLKELPDLSKAANLEMLTLIQCTSLVDFPSFILDLQKLETLRVWGCKNLRVVPASHWEVGPSYCSGFRNFPEYISMNMYNTYGGGAEIEEDPLLFSSSFNRRAADRPRHHRFVWRDCFIRKSRRDVNLSYRYIKEILNDVKGIRQLCTLVIKNCRYRTPTLHKILLEENYVSLERVAFPIAFLQVTKELIFHNCLKLDEESRRAIIHYRQCQVCMLTRC